MNQILGGDIGKIITKQIPYNKIETYSIFSRIRFFIKNMLIYYTDSNE